MSAGRATGGSLIKKLFVMIWGALIVPPALWPNKTWEDIRRAECDRIEAERKLGRLAVPASERRTEACFAVLQCLRAGAGEFIGFEQGAFAGIYESDLSKELLLDIFRRLLPHRYALETGPLQAALVELCSFDLELTRLWRDAQGE